MTKKGPHAAERRREEAILKLWEAYDLIDDEHCDIRVLVRFSIVGLAEKVPVSSAALEETPPL